MSKWKCDRCGKKFDNFHAQGFDNNVYCPSCFVREENKRLREKIKDLEEKVILLRASEPMLELEKYYGERDKYKEVIEEVIKSIEDFQKYIDEAKKMYSDLNDDNIVKASCMQLLNNQMVRNYDLLRILNK